MEVTVIGMGAARLAKGREWTEKQKRGSSPEFGGMSRGPEEEKKDPMRGQSKKGRSRTGPHHGSEGRWEVITFSVGLSPLLVLLQLSGYNFQGVSLWDLKTTLLGRQGLLFK